MSQVGESSIMVAVGMDLAVDGVAVEMGVECQVTQLVSGRAAFEAT
jgi:hypothetical protein